MRFIRAGASAVTAVALALFVSAAVAQASTITSGGFDQAQGCSDVSCGVSQTLTLENDALVPVSGTIDLDPDLAAIMPMPTLSLQIALDSTLALVPVPPATNDIGVARLEFPAAVYSAPSLALMDLGGGAYLIVPGQSAMVSGVVTQFGLGGGSESGAFVALAASVSGQCSTLGGGLSCGVSFGQVNMSLEIGAPPENRYIQHTGNFFSVPEPTTFALMGLALLGAVASGRRHI